MARNTYSLVQTCRGGCDRRCHLPLFVQQQLVLRALLMNQTLLLCNQWSRLHCLCCASHCSETSVPKGLPFAGRRAEN